MFTRIIASRSASMPLAHRAAATRLPAQWQGRRAFSTPKSLVWQGGLKDLLRVSEEVADAVATNKPVVALESTIYTHGAVEDLGLEEIVRANGGVPAVVGVLDGVPSVGLLPHEIDRMCQGSPKKVSRRDVAFIVGKGLMGEKMNGGTTISGTMLLARLAGIRVFGTGGLGGVHRGGHNSLDISADLTELGRTRVAVVCSGSKGFLDIPRTLEYLETQGVLVSTFSDSGAPKIDFPAFWARESGIPSPSVVYNEREAAAMILAQERLQIETGLLFASPIPHEFEIPRQEMDSIIDQAVRESQEQGAHGNENTPFILKRIKELTGGRSVPANKALVQSNVDRAAKIAAAVSQIVAGDIPVSHIKPVTPQRSSIAVQPGKASTSEKADIIVAGSVAVDLSCDYASGSSDGSVAPNLHTSNPAQISQSIGGVGRNVALAAHRANSSSKVKLCSLIGDDLAGSTVLTSLETCGMDTSLVRRLDIKQYPGSRTAQYVAVNDANKNLVMAMADMGIFTAQSFPAHWHEIMSTAAPKWLVVDANWSDVDIRSWITAAKDNNKARVAFEPVSLEKSTRLFSATKNLSPLGVFPDASVHLASPNQYELKAMHDAAQAADYFEPQPWWNVLDAFGLRGARDQFVRLTSVEITDAGIPQQMVRLLPYIPTIITKMGSKGALLASILPRDDPRLFDAAHEPYILSRSTSSPDHHTQVGGLYMRSFPTVEQVADVVSVNGVGDTFLGVLVAGLAQGGKMEDLVDVAQRGAVMTLRSAESVSPRLGELEKELAYLSSLAKR
ncbi:Indigoidine synthase A like protein-domain-containing protein [Microdochium bolleyi]|uniref:Indigoidine synthase A like protein-domain-containing protein n=1 Tax=Microdochium bolleyi TaxID=196109 RepID=A0A136JF81_9PEZI|nr:Indigoidine synthase A like protein-domain-containing protein [Microdochium bolleyi]